MTPEWNEVIVEGSGGNRFAFRRFARTLAWWAAVAVLIFAVSGCERASRTYTASEVHHAFSNAGLKTHVVFTPASGPATGFVSGRAGDAAGLRSLFSGSHLIAMVGGPQQSVMSDGPPFDVTAWIYKSNHDANRFGARSYGTLTALRRGNIVITTRPRYEKRVASAIEALH